MMADTTAALHYERLARQAQAMRAAQADWDNRLPPEQDDDAPTEDQAREAAAAQVLATPDLMAHWLAHACGAERKPVDMGAITAYALLSASVPTLLAVLLAGDDRHASRALHRLRELAAEHNADVIEQRAQRLLQSHQLDLPLCAD